MKMLTCFIEPSRGDARIGGKSVLTDTLAVRRQIGYLPENAPSWEEMTVQEFLYFIAEIRGIADRVASAHKMRDLCALHSVWLRPIETLSKGYRQRVGFAQALIHDPPVLILDEPTDGLDPNQKHDVRQIIRDMARDKTIILSTHILEEVEQLCERVIIIAAGEIVADATPRQLRTQSTSFNAVNVTFNSSTDITAVSAALTAHADIAQTEELTPASLRVYPQDRKKVIAPVVTKIMRDHDWSLKEIFVEQGQLDEVFRKVTTQEAR